MGGLSTLPGPTLTAAQIAAKAAAVKASEDVAAAATLAKKTAGLAEAAAKTQASYVYYTDHAGHNWSLHTLYSWRPKTPILHGDLNYQGSNSFYPEGVYLVRLVTEGNPPPGGGTSEDKGIFGNLGKTLSDITNSAVSAVSASVSNVAGNVIAFTPLAGQLVAPVVNDIKGQVLNGQAAIVGNVKAGAGIAEGQVLALGIGAGGTKGVEAGSQALKQFNKHQGIHNPEGTSIDVNESSAFVDVAVPTQKAVFGAGATVIAAAYPAVTPLVAPVIALNLKADELTGIPVGSSWFDQNASTVGLIAGAAEVSGSFKPLTDAAVKAGVSAATPQPTPPSKKPSPPLTGPNNSGGSGALSAAATPTRKGFWAEWHDWLAARHSAHLLGVHHGK